MASESTRVGSTANGKDARPCPFAQALLGFVDTEINKTQDKKCRFSTEVLQVARQLKDSKTPFEDSALSAAALMKCISGLEESQKSRSKMRKISTRLEPLVKGLSQYISVVDTMIQADPTPGALIYGGAKLVLQLASGFSGYFEKVVDKMREIGSLLALFDVYSKVYNWSQPMYDALASSYRSILEFWKNAARIFTRKTIKTLVRGLAKPFNEELDALFTGLERDTQSVDRAARAAQATASHKHEQAQAREQEVSKRERIVNWLAAAYYKTYYEKYQSLRHPGTCEWLLEHETFKTWGKSRKNEVLWLHAIPGAGKSVLCSRVIEELESERKNVVYFFFTFDETVKSQCISMLRSLILQLLTLFQQIPDEFCSICEKEKMMGQNQLESLTVAEKLVNTLLRRIPRVHVVIDGLDECSDRPRILQTLGRLFKQNSFGIVKWFCASRDEFDIRETFAPARKIPVEGFTQPDIVKFLDEDPYFAENGDQNHTVISHLSEGSFLWAKLTLDVLRGTGLTCDRDIEEALESFYPGLQGCYLRALQHLAKKSPKEQELARKIFMFVSLAPQPMAFGELSEALAVEPNMLGPDEGRIPRAAVVEELCCPLIILDRTESEINPTLHLAHKTIGEFLLQDPAALENVPKECWKFFVDLRKAHLDIGKICLTYLSYTRYVNPIDLEIELPLRKHAFLKYAAIFWHKHLSNVEGTRELFDKVSGFLRSCNFWTCMQVQSMYAPYIFARLTPDEGGICFRMSGPDDIYQQDPEEFYSDALPGWLTDFGDEGRFLVRAYQLFVMEWGMLLVRHPGKIELCCSTTLGKNDFFFKLSKDKTALLLENGHNSNLLCTSDGNGVQTPAFTQLISFEPTDIGLRATVANFSTGPESVMVNLQDWLLNLSGGGSAVLSLEKRADFPTQNLPLSTISGASSQPGSNPLITSFKKANPVITTVIEPGVLSIGDTPIDIFRISGEREQVSKIDLVASQAMRGFMAQKKKDWVFRSRQIANKDSTVALALRFSIPENRGSSFVDSGYGTDSSDDEDEAPASANYIAIFNGNGEYLPLWFEFENDQSVLRQSPPVFHPTKPLMIWPVGSSSFLFVNHTTGGSQTLNMGAGKYLSDKSPVARDFHISRSGTKIHEAVARTQNFRGVVTWTVERITSDLSVESDDPALSKVTYTNSSTAGVSWSTGRSGTYNDPNSPELPCSFTWTESYLYVTFGSCEMNVCRISLPQDGKTEGAAPKSTVEKLRNTMFLPMSSNKRGVRFFCHSANETNYGIFALGGTAELPPATIIRHIDSDLGGWELYEGNDMMVLEDESYDRCMKGIYAAGEPMFSIPIRSSLAWQVRTHVTCY